MCVVNKANLVKQLLVVNIVQRVFVMAKRAAGFLIFRCLCNDIEYLLLRASYGSHHWTPPKGHVDPGEDDFTTALRETREEAGYTENDLIIYKDKCHCLNYDVNGKPKVVVYWLAELRNPQQPVQLSEEHTEYKWLKKDAAKDISGYKDMQDMLDVTHQTILDMKKFSK